MVDGVAIVLPKNVSSPLGLGRRESVGIGVKSAEERRELAHWWLRKWAIVEWIEAASAIVVFSLGFDDWRGVEGLEVFKSDQVLHLHNNNNPLTLPSLRAGNISDGPRLSQSGNFDGDMIT